MDIPLIGGMLPDIPSIGMPSFGFLSFLLPLVVVAGIALVVPSMKYIGPNEVGVLVKKIGKKLPSGEILAFNGEAGYQDKLLRSGWNFVAWPLYRLETFPIVQTPARSVGIVVSQIGKELPAGAKTATGEGLSVKDFTDPKKFKESGGEIGVQRIVIPPSATVAIHPIAFIVKTTGRTFGRSLNSGVEEELKALNAGLIEIGSYEHDLGGRNHEY